jgi:hypothetical protein
MTLERVPEHRLLGNALSAARLKPAWQFPQGLFPPPRNEPPHDKHQIPQTPSISFSANLTVGALKVDSFSAFTDNAEP